ncbi:MAG: hypothetical protein H8E37_11830 [Planctomycetes bacterium]|nr:hypothetical protein [Planctomycetota bacterium]
MPDSSAGMIGIPWVFECGIILVQSGILAVLAVIALWFDIPIPSSVVRGSESLMKYDHDE